MSDSTHLGTSQPTLGDRLARMPVAAGIAIFLAVLVIVFGVARPAFLSWPNFTTILAASSVIMIAALGQLLAVISGGFDLSIGGMVPLSAVSFALVTSASQSFVVGLAVSLGIGVVLGLVHAFAIGVLRFNPLIATLATLSITGGIAFILANGQTVGVPASVGFLGERVAGGLAVHVFLTLALALVLHVVLRHTIFGRRVYLVGGNPEAARLAGVRVLAVQAGVYVLSALLSAIAGVVIASQLLAATGGVGAEITLQTLTAVVLGGAVLTGGRGSVLGSFVGVLLLGVISNGLTILRVPSFYQEVVTGLVLLIAVGLGAWQLRRKRSL